MAHEAGLDLAEVNSLASPPVVKILDYGKYRYSLEKQLSRQKSKSKGPEIKEIRLSLKISPHDLDFKLKQAQRFLGSGDKVRVVVKLVGREMMFSPKARELIENFRKKVLAEYETSIERMGNRFSAILTRK